MRCERQILLQRLLRRQQLQCDQRLHDHRRPDDGIANYGGSHNTYQWNKIYGNGLNDLTTGHYAQGVYEDANSSYNVFNGNLVYDNGSIKHYDHNFYLQGFYDVITNNVAYNALGYNFQFYNESASGTNVGYKVYNNVAVGATYGGFVLADNVQGLDFENNIAYGNATYGVGGSTGYGSGVVLKNNIGYSNGSRATSAQPAPARPSNTPTRTSPTRIPYFRTSQPAISI